MRGILNDAKRAPVTRDTGDGDMNRRTRGRADDLPVWSKDNHVASDLRAALNYGQPFFVIQQGWLVGAYHAAGDEVKILWKVCPSLQWLDDAMFRSDWRVIAIDKFNFYQRNGAKP